MYIYCLCVCVHYESSAFDLCLKMQCLIREREDAIEMERPTFNIQHSTLNIEQPTINNKHVQFIMA